MQAERMMRRHGADFLGMHETKMMLDQVERELVMDHHANPNMVVYIRADKNGRVEDYVLTPDGHLQGFDSINHPFPVVENGTVHSTDDRVMPFLRAEKAEVEVFPLINNFEPVSKQWLTNIGDFLMDPAARQTFRTQLLLYLSSDRFKGAAIDFEEIPLKAQPGFLALIQDLGQDLHARGLRLYVKVHVSDKDFDYQRLAASSDGLVIMNYDQHQTTSAPGPVAAQDWFNANLKQAVKDIPKTKIICAIGSYGYDWAVAGKKRRVVNVDTNNVQEAWLHARESQSEVALNEDSLNPHFAYVEDTGVEHQVWFLDAVTALNHVQDISDDGFRGVALWRLGGEDPGLWTIFKSHTWPADDFNPVQLFPLSAQKSVQQYGSGEVLRITDYPHDGSRNVWKDKEGDFFEQFLHEFDPVALNLQLLELTLGCVSPLRA